MANDKPEIKKVSGKINSKWMQNAVKSLGLAGTEVIKEIFPATTSAVTSTSKLASDAIKSARSATRDSRSISNTLNQMSGVKMAKQVVENSIADLKSGKLYNDERDPFGGGSDGFGENDVDTMFGDIDDMFSDDESGGDSAPDVQINNQVLNRNDDGSSQNATIRVLQETTKHQLSASKAQIDAMVSISSMQMARTSEMGAKIVDALDAINNNIAALIEFNNDNMTKLISASISYYEQMGLKQEQNYSGGKGEIKPEDIFSSGGFNASTYKDYIKQNIHSSTVASMLGLVTDQKDMIASNPVGMVLQSVMKNMIPKIAENAMEEFDKTVSNFIPNMLERVADWGDGGDNSFMGMTRKAIGSIFGIRNKRSNFFNPKKADATPMPWNGISNHTLVEVIPKYLRESTGYLQEIAEAVTGKTRDQMSDKFVGYNWETGQFQGINDQRNQITDTIINNTVDTISKSDAFKQLQFFANSLKDKKLGEELKAMTNEFAVRIEQHQGPIHWENKDDIAGILDLVKSATPEARKAALGMFQNMYENNNGALGDLNSAKRKASQGRREYMASLERDAGNNNINQVLDGRSTDQWIEDRLNAKIADKGKLELTPVNKGMSVPTILSEINSVLHRGLYVVLKTRFPGEKGDSASVSPDSKITADGKSYVKTDSGLILPAQQKTPAATINANPEVEPREELSVDDYAGVYDFHKKEAEAASVKGEPNKYQLGQHTAGFFNTLSGLMNGIMNGDADRAFDNVMNSIYDKFVNAGREISAKFLEPIKAELFGEKNDKTGYKDGGLLSGVTNRMRESMFALRHMITGEGYITADGKKVAADKDGNTVKAKLTGLLHNLSNGIKVRIFGEKEDGKNTKEGLLQKAQDGMGKAVSSFNKGLAGWKHALFGDKYDDDEDPEKTGKEVWEDIKKKASDTLPSALAGSVVGAGGGAMAGGVLGTLVGGPIGGALLGFAGGIASKSESFKNWLFGKEDKDGNRAGGLISADTQKFFKDHAAFLTGGAAIGAIKGGITGGGVLGTLVGGPVAGALMGLATATVVKSGMFQRFLFGDNEKGQLGLVTLGKQWMSNIVKSNSKEGGVDGSKLLGMTGIGAATGGILGMLVGGPIVGASVGLGAAILAQKDNFHAWLFGEDDPKTGAHKEGVFGKIKNTLMADVINPIKRGVQHGLADARTFLEYDVFNKFKIAIESIGEAISATIGNITDTMWNTTKSVGKFIKEDFLGGLINAAGAVLSPITDAAKMAGSAIWTATKAVISTPINILYAITSPIADGIRKAVGTVVGAVINPVGAVLGGALNIFGKAVKGAATVVGNAVALPFKAVKSTMDFINEKILGTIGHIYRFTTQVIEDGVATVKKFVLEHGPISWMIKGWNNAKEFFGDIKVGISEMLDPVKDAMKSAISYAAHSIVDHVKESFSNSIKNFFHALNPLTWIKKGAALLGFGKKDEGGNKQKGYFASMWEKTRNGYDLRDQSDTLVYDENGNQVGRKKGIGRSNAMKWNDRYGYNAKQENKRKAKEDNQRTKNERMIRKLTKGQRYEDTEENRQLAFEMGGKKKINWGKIDAVKPESVKKTEKFQDKSIDIQAETNASVKDIARFLLGKTPKTSLWNERTKQYNEGQVEGSLYYKRDQAAQKKRKSVQTDFDERSVERMNANIEKAKVSESEARRKKYDDLFEKRGFWGGLAAVEANLRGIRKGIKLTKKGKDLNIPGHADGTDNAEAGPSWVSENGPEVIEDSNGNAVITGNNGPELVNMAGGERVIPNGGIMGVFNSMLKILGDIRDNIQAGFSTTNNTIEESAGATIAPPPALPEGSNSPIALLPQVTSATDPEANKPKIEFNQAKGKTAEEQKAAAAAVDAKAKEDSFKNQVTEGINNVNESVKSHSSIWNSIFSKKGLITAGIIAAAPFIFKVLKKIYNWFANSTGEGSESSNPLIRLASDIQYGSTRLGDGRTTGDVARDEIDGLARTGASLAKGDVAGAVGNFIYDKEGQVYNETGARAKWLTKTAATGAKNVGKVMLGYKIARGAVDVIPDEIAKKVSTVSSNIVKDMGVVGEKEASGTAVKVGEFAGKTAEKIAATTEKVGSTKVVQIIKNVFNTIAKAASEKFGKAIGSTFFGKLLANVTGAIKTGWSWIASKVTAILSGAAALGSTVVGYLAKEGTWVTLGLINGLSGAARLFRTNGYVDAKMVLISGLFGALAGTTPGSVADCVNELVVSLKGFDMFTELATLIYQLVSGEDDFNKLTSAQTELKDNYDKSVDEDLKKQYQTKVATGLIDGDSIDEATWVEGAKAGKYDSNIQSFADYNDEQNQTLGSRISSGLKNTVGKAIGGIKKSLVGYSEEKYVDSQNPTIEYRKNENGTFSAFNTQTGEQIGDGQIDRSSLENATYIDENGEEVSRFYHPTEKHDGLVQKAWTGIKDFGRNTVTGVKNAGASIASGIKTAGGKFVDSAKSLGSTVGGFFTNLYGNITGSLSDAIGGFKTGMKKIEDNFDNKDVDFMTYVTDNVNTVKEDNPLHGLVGLGLNVGKIGVFGAKLFGAIGSKIAKAASGVFDTARGAVATFGNGIAGLFQKAIGGNLIEFLSYAPTAGDGIINTIINGAIHIAKIPSFIVAVASAAGHAIYEPVSKMIETGKTMWTAFTGAVGENNQIMLNGDPASLLASDSKVAEGTPFSGVLNFGVSALKYLGLIPASAIWLGKKAGSAIGGLIESGKEEFSIIGTNVDDLFSAAVAGDPNKYNAVTVDGDGHTMAKAITVAAKVVLSPIAGVSTLGHKALDGVKKIFDSGKNLAKDVGTYAATLSSYTDLNKNMNNFFNEKMSGADKNPAITVVQAIVSGVMNVYVSLIRSVKSVAQSIKDKVNGIGTWIMDLIRGEGDDVNDGIDDAATSSGNGGKGGRRGGRGIAPSTLNGGTYFSQNDSRWGNDSYTEANGNDAGATMGDSGCGPTAMAMALNDVTGRGPDPTTLARFAQRTGDRDSTGTNANFVSNAANAYGVSSDETMNPSAGTIVNKLQSSGNPVVLLGQNSGGNGPYTSSGHYIVAEGLDNNGNVVVNDPRGPEYSGSVSPSQLAGSTSSAWSFGGRGTNRVIRRAMGGYGNREKWINIVAEVKRQIAASKHGYDQGGTVKVTINGKSINVRTDCSGLVVGCLQFYGVLPVSRSLTSDAIADTNNSLMRATGFTPKKFTSWKDLSKGDIVARKGHTEIFAAWVNGKKYVYNVGSTPSANDPYATPPLDQDHTTVWTVGNPGANCVNAPGDGNVQVDTNYKGGDAEVTTVSGSSSDSSGSTNFFSKVTGAFSAVGSALLEAALTGNAPDWNKVVTDYQNDYSSSSDSSSYSDDDYSGDTGDAGEYNASIIKGNKGMTTTGGSSNQAAIWKSLRAFGLSKAGTAGLMGAWTAESGLRPNNLENKFEKKYGNDVEYTNKVDSSHKWPDSPSDHVGYGLAQWTGANGNATSGNRKHGLLALANGSGASVGNLGIQLQWAESELKSRYLDAYKYLKDARTPEYGAAAALGLYEMPSWGITKARTDTKYYPSRKKNAIDIYNKFANERRAGYGGHGAVSDAIGDALVNYYDENAPKAYKKLTGHNAPAIDRKAIREQEAKRKADEAEAKRRASLSASELFAEDVVAPILSNLMRQGLDAGKNYIDTHVNTTGVDGVAGASKRAPANKRGKGGRGVFGDMSLADIFGQDTLDQVSAMSKDMFVDVASDVVRDNRGDIDKTIADGTTKATEVSNSAAAKLDEMFPGMGLGDALKQNVSAAITENMPTIKSTLDNVAAHEKTETTTRNLYQEYMDAYNKQDWATIYSMATNPNLIATGSSSASNATIQQTAPQAAADTTTVQPQNTAADTGATLNNNINYTNPVTPASNTVAEEVQNATATTGTLYTTTSTPANVEVVNQYQNAGGSSTETTSQIVTLIGKVVDILGNINTNTNNLGELDAIKKGIENIHIPTLPTGGSGGRGESTSTNNSKPSVKVPFRSNGGFGNDGISNAELTARRIAFGI